MNNKTSLIEIARKKRMVKEGQLSRARVLFVDDEERILHTMLALFKDLYDVNVASSGKDAIALVRQNHFHLVVSDQRMPEMEGIEVLRQVKEISPNTVRILLTGFADLAAIVDSVNVGEVYRYLTKPWRNDELRDTIENAVRIGVSIAEEKQNSGDENFDVLFGDIVPNILFLEQKNHASAKITQSGLLKGVNVFEAQTVEESLLIMHDNEISLLLVSVDQEEQSNIEFLNVIKEQFPQIITIAIADQADAKMIITLINSARIWRVIFRPIDPKTAVKYIKLALDRAKEYRNNPNLIKTQQAATAKNISNEEVKERSVLRERIGNKSPLVRTFNKK